MPPLTFTSQEIKRLCQYAQYLPPSPRVSYPLLHPEICVPKNCLPVKIAQYYQYDSVTRTRLANHWSIFIPTSEVPGVGMHYDLGREIRFGFHERYPYRRGTHTIGYVLPTLVPSLESHFASVPMDELTGEWKSQLWVCFALQGWDTMFGLEWLDPAAFLFTEDKTYGLLVKQMQIVDAAWEDGSARVF